jgi:hypothetical protein
MIRNWRTSLAGIVGVACFAVGIFLPEYKALADGIAAAIFGAGFLAAKDGKVTGL